MGAVITLCYDSSHSSHKTRLTAYFIAGKFCKQVECYDLVLTQQQGMAFFDC